MLDEAKIALIEQKKITGDYEFVFVNSSKKQFYSHDIIAKRFKTLLDECSIAHRPLYALRHTFASTLIAKGVDMVWVSRMLGHKDISITLKIYTKFIEKEDDERLKNIDKMGTILGTIKN